MAFLNPLFLWMLAGAGIPIIIHLFSRRRGTPFFFSTIRFLKLTKLKTSRRQKVEEIIVLAIRTLLLIFLVFVLAEPVSKLGSLFFRETYVVFLFDDSLSMTAGNSQPWQAAQKAALEILSSLKKPVQVALVFTSGRREPFSGDLGAIGETVRKCAPSMSAGNLSWALDASLASFKGKSGTKTIYLFTDMQKYLWRNVSFKNAERLQVKITVVDLGAEITDNVSFKEIYRVSGTNSYRSEITNWGHNQAAIEVDLAAGIGSDRKSIVIPPGKSADVEFSIAGNPDEVTGNIRYPDAIQPDNSFCLALTNPEKKRILVIGEDPESAFYVQKSLNAIDESMSVDVRKPGQLENTVFEEYRIVFLVNSGRMDAQSVRKLSAYVASGGNIVVFPGDRVSPETFNNDWSIRENEGFVMPARLDVPSENTNPQRVAWVESKHPLFSIFGGRIFEYLKTTEFRRVFRLKEVTGDILMKLSDGSALLAEKKSGKGRILLFTFLPSDLWTNLQVKPFYVVLMNALKEYLSGAGTYLAKVGEPVDIPLPESVESAQVTSPDGRTLTVGKHGEGRFFIPDVPGFWKVKSANPQIPVERIVSVNCDWEEGNLERISYRDVDTALRGADVSFVKRENVARLLAKRSASRDLADMFLNMALFLLMAELGASSYFLFRKAGDHV